MMLVCAKIELFKPSMHKPCDHQNVPEIFVCLLFIAYIVFPTSGIECEQKTVVDHAERFTSFLAEHRWLRNFLKVINECWNS
jgi:hypothetical protein